MPLSRMWCTRVVISRAPDPPRGCPSAIAPPLGFSAFSSAPRSLSQASGTGAKASLTSNAPMSEIDRPDFFSAFCVAGIGACSIGIGSAAARAAVCTRASGVRPCAAANSLVVISSAAEPSEICEELPAWMTPSSLKAGLSEPSFSMVPPRRTPSSVSITTPSGLVTGAIWFLNRPSSMAAAAFSCDASENSSSCWRDRPHRSAICSAPMPWFGNSSPYRSMYIVPSGLAVKDEPIGVRDMTSTPPATARSYCPETTPAAAKWTDCWRTALAVDRRARDRLRPAGRQDRSAGDVEGLLADLHDAAPDDVVDQCRVDTGPLDDRLQDQGRQVSGVDAREAAVALADGGA